MTGTRRVNSAGFICRSITCCILLAFSAYDIRNHKVRNPALAAFLPWCLFTVMLTAWSDSAHGMAASLAAAGSGFLCGGILLLSVAVVTNGGIGGGDIKLAALLGLIYGTAGILLILTTASLLAFACSGIFIAKKKKTPARIAFVPYMAAGCFLATAINLK